MITKEEKARRILNDLCLYCGKKADHEHHIIPRSFAGPDITIPLCGEHHAACHGLGHHTWNDHSRRTVGGLQRAKEEGKELGKHGKYVLSKKNKQAANSFARSMTEHIGNLELEGFSTLMQKAEELNRRGIPTATGKGRWYISTVHALIKRIENVTGVPLKQ